MHLFKAAVFHPKDVEGTVIGLEPKIFNSEVPTQIIAASGDENKTKKFQLNELSIQTTGLEVLKQQNLENKINEEVLKKLKSVEEKAYADAHKLGLEDGRKEAFQSFSEQITESLENVKNILAQVNDFKSQIFIENEAEFIKLIHSVASCIVYKTVKEDPAITLEVLKKVLDDTHSDEEITLKLNKEDMEFLNTVTATSQKPWENAKKIKMEVQEGVTRGGCIIETNHGVVDARIEQRVQKAWKSLESRIPKPEHNS